VLVEIERMVGNALHSHKQWQHWLNDEIIF
jgi:hypothetical protein